MEVCLPIELWNVGNREKLHGDEGHPLGSGSLYPCPGSWKEPEERTGIGSRSSPASQPSPQGAQQPFSMTEQGWSASPPQGSEDSFFAVWAPKLGQQPP